MQLNVELQISPLSTSATGLAELASAQFAKQISTVATQLTSTRLPLRLSTVKYDKPRHGEFTETAPA